MAIIHLVRHGHHPLLGRVLCGRGNDVLLDGAGIAEMQRVARFFIDRQIDGLQSSPQPRALQSATVLARYLGIEVVESQEADELDCGRWTGCSFDDLDGDADWQKWNASRGTSAPPQGESMRELQQRMCGYVKQLAREKPAGELVVVSHAEPIRAVMLHCLGLPLDRFLDVAVDPGTISTILIGWNGAEICRINARPDR